MIDLLAVAQGIVRNKLTWSSGEQVDVVRAGKKHVYLVNNGGFIYMHASYKAGPRLTDRYTSKGLPVGLLDPAANVWRLVQADGFNSLDVTYGLWLNDVQDGVREAKARADRRQVARNPRKAFTRKLLLTRDGNPKPAPIMGVNDSAYHTGPRKDVKANAEKWGQTRNW